MFVDAVYLRGTEKVMDMRTHHARFSRGRIPSENQDGRVRGFTFYFVYFATLATERPYIALVIAPSEASSRFPSQEEFRKSNFEMDIVRAQSRSRLRVL